MPLPRAGPQAATMGVIVLATDGSEAAGAALEEAIALARETGDTLAVITVWRALQDDFGLVFPPGAPLEALLDAERLHAEATLAGAVARAGEEGVEVEARLAAGDPATMICAFADEVGARLIAMGTRGHGHVVSVFVGSVSAAVVKQARRPVMIVPAPAARRPVHARRAVAAR